MWNISKKKALLLIDEIVGYMFFTNNSEILPKNYIYMNLNKKIIGSTGFIFKKNGKRRNVNNYVGTMLKGWNETFQNFDNYIIIGKYIKLV